MIYSFSILQGVSYSTTHIHFKILRKILSFFSAMQCPMSVSSMQYTLAMPAVGTVVLTFQVKRPELLTCAGATCEHHALLYGRNTLCVEAATEYL